MSKKPLFLGGRKSEDGPFSTDQVEKSGCPKMMVALFVTSPLKPCTVRIALLAFLITVSEGNLIKQTQLHLITFPIPVGAVGGPFVQRLHGITCCS